MRLRYYPDSNPGFTRQRRGRGFSFLAPDGTRVDQSDVLKRLKGLAVPPAYRSVWMSPFENGHLQATGRDDKGRKQYQYHADWAQQRSLRKFDQLVPFALKLPRIRRWINDRLAGDPGAFDTAVATILALMDRASMRVGSPEYTAENGSHGATTLLSQHVTVSGECITLNYPAKGGAMVTKRLRGHRLARTLEACQDLPGADLLAYGETASIRSEHLQQVLADLTEDETITPKTFRTWNGSHAAFCAAAESPTIKAVAAAASDRLHNTPSIARSSYIHPAIIELAKQGEPAQIEDATPDGMRRGEMGLLALLDR